MHTKLGYFLGLQNFITLYLKKLNNDTFVTGAPNNGKFNEIDRTSLAYTEGEIGKIMSRGVICADKSYFLMPDHKYR